MPRPIPPFHRPSQGLTPEQQRLFEEGKLCATCKQEFPPGQDGTLIQVHAVGCFQAVYMENGRVIIEGVTRKRR